MLSSASAAWILRYGSITARLISDPAFGVLSVIGAGAQAVAATVSARSSGK